MVIRVIVDADSIDDAVSKAEQHFEDKLVPDSTFDYCKPMESGLTVAGSDRWWRYQGDPNAYIANRMHAMQEIQRAFEMTKESWAQHFSSMMVKIARECPDAVQEIVDSQRGRGDISFKEEMSMLSEEFMKSITNSSERIDNQGIIDEQVVENLMYDQHNKLRYSASCLAHRQYVHCYLYDVTYYGDGSGSAVDSVEIFEEIFDKEYLDGKYVVPLDAHH